MQVNAIQSSLGFTGRFQRSNKNIDDAKIVKDDTSRNPYNNNVSNRAMRNAAKAAVVGMFMVPMGAPLMTSCDTESYAEAWADAEANAKDSCGCNYVNGKDTIIFVIPGKDSIVHDTITQIIENRDTVYIKKCFDSPVIDALRDFFEATDIDLGDERIPLTISWIDEQNVPARPKQVFDGRSSSYDELNYTVQRTPWNDETGSFVIGQGDTYENIRYSLTSDGKLMMSRYVPRNPYVKPQSRGEWIYSNSAVYDINTGDKIVNRYTVNDDGSEEYAGSFQPGELDNTIKVTNPYGTDWRYSNVKVVTGKAPDCDE